VRLKLDDGQWLVIEKELPLRSDIRIKVKELRKEAMTWGEEEGEFTSDETAALKNLGFPWLDELIGETL
jgi:hypothetical protein